MCMYIELVFSVFILFCFSQKGGRGTEGGDTVRLSLVFFPFFSFVDQ